MRRHCWECCSCNRRIRPIRLDRRRSSSWLSKRPSRPKPRPRHSPSRLRRQWILRSISRCQRTLSLNLRHRPRTCSPCRLPSSRSRCRRPCRPHLNARRPLGPNRLLRHGRPRRVLHQPRHGRLAKLLPRRRLPCPPHHPPRSRRQPARSAQDGAPRSTVGCNPTKPIRTSPGARVPRDGPSSVSPSAGPARCWSSPWSAALARPCWTMPYAA